jgi:carbamoyltransferase
MIAILGINAFHADAAACLVIDGQLIGAVAEERLGDRIKHSAQFPENAIRRLLTDSNVFAFVKSNTSKKPSPCFI